MISLKRSGAFLLSLALLLGTMSMTSCKKDDAKGGSSASSSQGASKDDKKSSKTTSSDKDGSSKDGSSKDSSSKGDTETATAEDISTDSVAAFPPPPNADQLKSQCIYIINLDSGKEVWSRNPDQRLDPASVTKVMTCLLALENVKDLDKETASLTTDINNYLYEGGVDTLGGIYPGETFCIRDLLYAMMLQSANEAAMMVGKYVSTYGGAPEGGDLEVFAEMMNQKAKEIGAVNTHFANPTGLYDENNYSTAKDLALIGKYAWEHPDYGETFQQIVSSNAYKSNPTNTHPEGLTWYSTLYPQQSSQTELYNPNIHGIKTGTLRDQNIHNFVSTATRDGYTYLMAVCNAPVIDLESGQEYKYNLAFVDTKYLYENYVFDYFQVKTLINVGDLITEVPVNLSWDDKYVGLVAADKFASLVTTETTSDNVEKIPVFKNAKKRIGENKKEEYYFDAPINKGDELGVVKITSANLELGQVRLVAAKTIPVSKWLYYVDQVKQFMSKFVFKFLLTFVIVVVALYVALMIIRNHNKKRYRMKRRPPKPPRR